MSQNNNISDQSFSKRCDLLAPKIVKALQSRNFEVYYCKTKEEALKQALSLIPEDSSVSWGGSVTLKEIGLIDEIKKLGYKKVLDRDNAKTVEEKTEIALKALHCDTYLTSFNAISEDGQLVNIDGFGNRVAAITFGPKSVVAVIGMNKVCKTVEEAEKRARNQAAPLNAMRLNLTQAPCAVTGSCGDCISPECMCSYIVKTRLCRIPNRIKIILVGEQLGY